MVKLKFLLIEKTPWRLLLKTALGVGALLFIRLLNFHPFAVLSGFFVFLIIYFREAAERRFLRFSFWLLPALTFTILRLTNSIGPLGLIWLLFIFAILFFFILGLIDLFFKERTQIYGILNTVLMLAVFLIVFYFLNLKNFWILGIALFLFLFLLFSEVFIFFEIPKGKKMLAAGSALGLLGVELAWILNFLPLGFINAALFLTLFFLLIKDALVSKAKGVLTFAFVFRELTFFIILTIIIFAASHSFL